MGVALLGEDTTCWYVGDGDRARHGLVEVVDIDVTSDGVTHLVIQDEGSTDLVDVKVNGGLGLETFVDLKFNDAEVNGVLVGVVDLGVDLHVVEFEDTRW